MAPHTVETADIGILTVIRPELTAAREALGLTEKDRDKLDNGTVVLRGTVRSELRKCDYRVVLACIGGAGNPAAAAAATSLIEKFKPKCMVLMGIAAGVRGKVRIGEVVLPERVVAYEPAALVQEEDGTRTEQRRPEIERIANSIRQDIVHYPADVERIGAIFKRIAGAFPKAPRGKRSEWAKDVLTAIKVNDSSTLASGEKLLRDPNKLLEVRRDIHGKVELGEMEAMGLIEACRLYAVPWLIVRGISDFGDTFKDDSFHDFASRTAAAVLADFLKHGLDLVGRAGTVDYSRHNPFRPGEVIDKDQDFFGRDNEKTNIVNAVGKRIAVQILGGALMGKTSLLHWIERHPPLGYAVVWLDSGNALSPVDMVRSIAKKLHREDVATTLSTRDATVHQAAEMLEQLLPFVLLIDDAEKLASKGRAFEEDFFEVVRTHVVNKRMGWISASRVNLYDLFDQKGLSSRLFSTSEKIWLGHLDDASARRLAGRARPEHVERILQVAGGFAYGVQWLGNKLSQNTGDPQDVYDEFEEEMQTVMRRWWDALAPEERALIRSCAAAEVDAQEVEDEIRQRLRDLFKCGYLSRQGARYRLAPGEVWGRFVSHAK